MDLHNPTANHKSQSPNTLASLSKHTCNTNANQQEKPMDVVDFCAIAFQPIKALYADLIPPNPHARPFDNLGKARYLLPFMYQTSREYATPSSSTQKDMSQKEGLTAESISVNGQDVNQSVPTASSPIDKAEEQERLIRAVKNRELHHHIQQKLRNAKCEGVKVRDQRLSRLRGCGVKNSHPLLRDAVANGSSVCISLKSPGYTKYRTLSLVSGVPVLFDFKMNILLKCAKHYKTPLNNSATIKTNSSDCEISLSNLCNDNSDIGNCLAGHTVDNKLDRETSWIVVRGSNVIAIYRLDVAVST